MDETLFEEDELRFQPAQGNFDLAKIGAAITGQVGFAFQDEAEPEVFVVCQDEASRTAFRERRREAPGRGFPHVLLIRLEPHTVTIYQAAGPEFAPLSRQFATWLTETYPSCTLRNEMGMDLTPKLMAAGS